MTSLSQHHMLIAQLRKDRDQFSFYATNHRAKTGDPLLTQAAREDAETKAVANETMAAEIDAVLKAWFRLGTAELCEDEGCPHYGISHVHATDPKAKDKDVGSSDTFATDDAVAEQVAAWTEAGERARQDAARERRVEMIAVLRQAHDEILTLQETVSGLTPRAHAYDTIAQLARISQHEEPQGYGIDIRWRLKGAIEELIAEREASRADAS